MTTRRICLLIAVSALAAVLLSSAGAQTTATISVDAAQVLGPVNHLVFGQNISAADNARIFSSDTTDMSLIQRGEGAWNPATAAPVPLVVEQSRAAGMSLLRYPGGCLAHNFDWRKTVGPQAKAAGWLFGLDEYLQLCAAIGAAPLITVSDYVLPAGQMPQNAAELVEYLNSPADSAHPWAMRRKEWGHPDPYHVVWFELGNESNHGNHRVIPHREYTPEQYAAYANATAAAMRRVDPAIHIGIVMTPGPGTDVNNDWNRTVVRLAGASADFLVLHIYGPQIKPDLPAGFLVQSMMVMPQHVEARLEDYHRMVREILGHDLPLAITEFNGALDQPAYRQSLADALECADLIRVFLEPHFHVALACYWEFLNGAFGMLQTNMSSPNGEPFAREPAFLLYRLWARHFGSQLVQVNVQSPTAAYAGSGSEEASSGSMAEPRQPLAKIDPAPYSVPDRILSSLPGHPQVQWQPSAAAVHVQDLTRATEVPLAHIPRPPADPATPVEVSLIADARFVPDPGSYSGPIAIGFSSPLDPNAARTATVADAAVWKQLKLTCRLDAKTTNVDLIARLGQSGANVSGTLELRNLLVVGFISAHAAAYPLLTSSASLSSDRGRLYLMVLNKSDSGSIPATIQLRHFVPSAARYWEVTGPSLSSAKGVTESQADAARFPDASSGRITHVFPPRSMTAIEFSR